MSSMFSPFYGAGLNHDLNHAVRPNDSVGIYTFGEDSNADGAEEEAEKSKGIRMDNRPSAKEVEEHERTHIPFRIWCEHCIMGRGKEDHHRTRDDSKQEGFRISWDYMYMK